MTTTRTAPEPLRKDHAITTDVTLKTRFAAVMRGLTRVSEGEDDGRVRLARLDTAMRAAFDDTEQIKSLRLYRAGRRVPDPAKAWILGETLRDIGVPWCSGLWMLWIAGHYHAVISIIAVVLQDRPKCARDRCDLLWHMLWYAEALTRETELDEVPPFTQVRVAKPAADDQTVGLLRQLLIDADPPRPRAHRVYDEFVRREIAKSAFSQYDDMRAELNVAFEAFNLNKTGDNIGSDRLLHAALAVTRARMPWREHEFVILVVVGSWFNSVEQGGGVVVLPRPLRANLVNDDPQYQVRNIELPDSMLPFEEEHGDMPDEPAEQP